MGLMDILQGQGAKDVTGERQSSTTPKGRIADSIQRQINVAEGKTEKVAGQEVKPWYDDELGGMRIKVGGFTLRTITMPKENYATSLKLMKEALDNDQLDDLVKAFTEKLNERDRRKANKK